MNTLLVLAREALRAVWLVGRHVVESRRSVYEQGDWLDGDRWDELQGFYRDVAARAQDERGDAPPFSIEDVHAEMKKVWDHRPPVCGQHWPQDCECFPPHWHFGEDEACWCDKSSTAAPVDGAAGNPPSAARSGGGERAQPADAPASGAFDVEAATAPEPRTLAEAFQDVTRVVVVHGFGRGVTEKWAKAWDAYVEDHGRTLKLFARVPTGPRYEHTPGFFGPARDFGREHVITDTE